MNTFFSSNDMWLGVDLRTNIKKRIIFFLKEYALCAKNLLIILDLATGGEFYSLLAITRIFVMNKMFI